MVKRKWASCLFSGILEAILAGVLLFSYGRSEQVARQAGVDGESFLNRIRFALIHCQIAQSCVTVKK
jgi:hypothetical protein